MSQTQRRSRNGGTSSRTQPSILKSRKRKLSENDLEPVKVSKRESRKMAAPMAIQSPLEDVTLTSLNVESATSNGSPSSHTDDSTSMDSDSTSMNVNVDASSLNAESERAFTPDSVPEEWNKFRGFTCYPTPTLQTKRNVPLPNLSWADKDELWELMCRKDRLYTVNPNYLMKHPALQPRMRTILLDWLTEVAEVYKLHRESYFLATAYIDRYLSLTQNVPKQQLQLIGITALFVASKIEEIYPPKLNEFSYVTDGACVDEEILEKELVILKTLNWDLNPLTPNCWLNTYLQLVSDALRQKQFPLEISKSSSEVDADFIYPHYSGLTFVQVSRLLDLCALDMSSLEFTPSKLAATALSFLATPTVACMVSGYSLDDLRECLAWMAPLAVGVQEVGPAVLRSFSRVAPDDMHNIQTHAVTLEVFERAIARRSQIDSLRSTPPAVSLSPEVLTPPNTDEKRMS